MSHVLPKIFPGFLPVHTINRNFAIDIMLGTVVNYLMTEIIRQIPTVADG